MQLKILILALTVTLSLTAAANDEFQNALQQQYEKHVVVLRSPFQQGDQEFDSSGKPLKDPPADQWRVYGPVFVRKFSIDSERLRLEGQRVAFRVDRKQSDKEVTTIPLGKPIRISIRLDQPLTSVEKAQQILNLVFFADAQKSDYPKPTFWRPDQTPTSDEPLYKPQRGQFPVPLYTPDPDYSEAARQSKFEGTVILSVIIDDTGRISRITIEKALGLGLDEQAVNKVKTWRFKPLIQDGRPLAIKTSVEVQFNLYH